MNYELWIWSRSQRRWNRCLFLNEDDALWRYECMRSVGVRATRPKPAGTGIGRPHRLLAVLACLAQALAPRAMRQ